MIGLTRTISAKQESWRNSGGIRYNSRQNGILNYGEMEKWFISLENDPTRDVFGLGLDTGEIVGTVGLSSIDLIHGHAEFSILIGPEYQGKGYGTEGLQQLLLYAFKHYPFECIYGETFEDNPARSIFKKIGFVEEGFLRKRYFKNGKYINSIAISILREEALCQKWWVH